MSNTPIPSIEAHFATLSDPRVNRTKKHKLLDIIIIAICAVICGADGWGSCRSVRSRETRLVSHFPTTPLWDSFTRHIWTRLWGLIPSSVWNEPIFLFDALEKCPDPSS